MEFDVNYNRVDSFKDMGEVMGNLANMKSNVFMNAFQLMDSFMRGVGFKLGKVAKFGA